MSTPNVLLIPPSRGRFRCLKSRDQEDVQSHAFCQCPVQWSTRKEAHDAGEMVTITMHNANVELPTVQPVHLVWDVPFQFKQQQRSHLRLEMFQVEFNLRLTQESRPGGEGHSSSCGNCQPRNTVEGSSRGWLREDEKSKEERKAEAEGKGEEKREERKREEEKEENETETVKRRCEGLVSVEAFDIFSQGGDVESCGDVSWEDLLDNPEDLSDCEPDSCGLLRAVPDVTDVLVSPSSVVTELCDVSPCGSDWEFVEPQFFSFSKKRARCGTDAGRDEVRRLTSESTAAFKKKDDTACTYAKFENLLCEGPRKV